MVPFCSSSSFLEKMISLNCLFPFLMFSIFYDVILKDLMGLIVLLIAIFLAIFLMEYSPEQPPLLLSRLGNLCNGQRLSLENSAVAPHADSCSLASPSQPLQVTNICSNPSFYPSAFDIKFHPIILPCLSIFDLQPKKFLLWPWTHLLLKSFPTCLFSGTSNQSYIDLTKPSQHTFLCFIFRALPLFCSVSVSISVKFLLFSFCSSSAIILGNSYHMSSLSSSPSSLSHL